MQRRKWIGCVGCGPILFGAVNVGLGANLAQVQNALYSSSNWSGYFASAPSGQAFTDISSTWVIPTVQPSSGATTWSADWVGFDGATNGTVEQCGTLSSINSEGNTDYYAWYEFYPQNLEPVSLAVNPGDTINAQITYQGLVTTGSEAGNYAYFFDLADKTTDNSFTTTLYTTANDARASAEWIDEAPGVNGKQSNIANFGSVTFSNDLAGLNGNSDQALILSPNEIELVQNGDLVALPTSIYSGGEAFNINSYLIWDNASATSANDGKTWDIDSNYNWHLGTGSTVYTDGSDVTFNDSNNGHYAVTLNTTVSPGSVTVNNSSGNYTISGTGSIAGAGSLTKSGTATLTLGTANTYSGGTTITAGTLIATGNNSLPAKGAVVNDGILNVNGNDMVGPITGTGSLTVGTGTSNNTLQIAANSPQSSQASITVAAGSTLDITNNSIIINYTGSDPRAYYQTLVNNGDNAGTWTGTTSITSSSVAAADAAAGRFQYAVAVADGGDASGDTTLGSQQLEITAALAGDCNLDGTVNATDLGIVLGDFGKTGQDWDEGDFNGDGAVDSTDLDALLGNWQATTALSVSQLDEIESVTGDSVVANADGVGYQLVSVPEPAALGLLMMAGAGVLARRRRGLGIK